MARSMLLFKRHSQLTPCCALLSPVPLVKFGHRIGLPRIEIRRCLTSVSRYAKTMAQPDVGLDKHLRGIPVVYGDLPLLPPQVKTFVEEAVALCEPADIHICDGTESENMQLIRYMLDHGTLTTLPKYENCYLARTDPRDVARVESKTFVCTSTRRESVPETKEGVPRTLGNWISPSEMDRAIDERFPGCMKGRTMYVIPFSMGPVGSPLSKVGVQVTDSPYVVCSMKIMTRMGTPVLNLLNQQDCDGEFVRCMHAVGGCNGEEFKGWPCDPERTIILQKPPTNEIVSFGSGYGGNSLLGKKCFALRIGSTIAKREGWLAEHMLILGITNPEGKKKYIVAAFPSACGKTNMAMMEPRLPGFKAECVGDDIAWMRFNEEGELRAINPENGSFGVAPGTSMKSNPVAMKTIFRNTIFTNVASTSDGGVYWEGLEEEVDPNVEITDWLGKPWDKNSGTPAAHPNSRFCTPMTQVPILDPDWEDPKGVPVSAVLFGGRRPAGVPLLYESFSWSHGVFLGASLRSEATAAAEFKGKVILHDPFAMRPFFGYNFGHYLQHWLSMQDNAKCKLPKIFNVNWFRKDCQGKFMWPGFGDNIRILDWVMRRVDNEDIAEPSPVGLIPKKGTLNLEGLEEKVNLDRLFSVPKDFWQEEVKAIQKYFEDNVGADLPELIANELEELRKRVEAI